MDTEHYFESNNQLDIHITFKDNKGRAILKVINEKVMATRYHDMDEYTKDQVVFLYSELTASNEKDLDLRGFLNFENNKNEFCS